MKTIVYDGSIEGFLSAIFYCYEQNEFDNQIYSKHLLQRSLFNQIVEVKTNEAHANRVKNGIIKKVGVTLLNEINTVFCSERENKDNVLFDYLKLIFTYGFKTRLMLNNEHVIAYNNLLKKVTYERHRMIGFMRFEETAEGVMYAKYSPDNNITHLLLGHFASRFSNQNFLIHDTKRNIVGVYSAINHQFFTYTLSSDLSPVAITESEAFFQKLWQNYYHDASIKERTNLNLMFAHMPKRYHANLSELKG
jgi:probable DNA metabolism protein